MFRNIYKKIIHNIKDVSSRRGMTLVELLVVLAIFVIVTGIVIFDYGSFRSNVSLQNLADDIALSIRRAQGYAIGVHSQNSFGFTGGYGVHFSTNSNPDSILAGSNKSFVLFADLPDATGVMDKQYNYDVTSNPAVCDSSSLKTGNECIDLLNINSADEIYAICPNGQMCDPGYTDVVFLRPNPDAYICTNTSSGGGTCDPASSVDIVIKNIQTDKTRTITVSATGLISVR